MLPHNVEVSISQQFCALKERHKDSSEPQGSSGPSWVHSSILTGAVHVANGAPIDWVLGEAYEWQGTCLIQEG